MRCVACVVLLCASFDVPAQAPPRVAIKGQVVYPDGLPIPQQKPVNVNADRNHCLANGPILDETVVVNPKTRGVKNVVVWLRPDDPNPKAAFPPHHLPPDDATRKPAEVVIDQPCCVFVNRVTAARVGDTLVVKNPAPVAHNFFWVSENNGSFNPNIPPKDEFRLPNPLAAETAPVGYSCSIHPWMKGYVRVFDHPYFAVTDADGKFEIKSAPAGTFRLVVWHEKSGFKGGRAGRLGDPVAVTDGGKGAMELPPVAWDVTK
jgi:hypothetical protein